MWNKRALLFVAVFATAAAFAGCTGKYKSDFSIIVVNRALNTIQVLANGSELGQVAAGQTGTFKVNLAETNTNEFTNGVAPTPQSQVTLSAKDAKTGILSTTKSVTLSQSTPTYVTFEAADFPVTVQTVARFTFSPNSPGVNEEVFFSASSSTVSGGTLRWDFGDGKSGIGVTISNRYAREGSYTVTLTATSDNGQSSTASRTVTVSASLPPSVANFTFSPAAPAVNQEVFFNASTSGVTSGTFAWDFGDGTTGSGVAVTHRYPRAGAFTVILRVSNAVGQSGATSRSVTVSSTSPQVVASFTFSPTNPSINQDIFFTSAASTPSNATRTWDFGDGKRDSGVSPSHRYEFGGTYNVTLTVTNELGQSASASRAVTVSATSPQVTASFVYSPVAPGVGQQIYFDAAASRPTSATFVWDFGDGSNFGSGVTPSHSYSAAGTYVVTLTVTNALGQSATVSRTVTASATSPLVTASFTFSPINPAINQDVFFNATASRPDDGTYTWVFGDGTPVGTGVTPIHRYAQAGTFTVTLTVSNSIGQTATASRTVTVSTTSPSVTASFTFSPTSPGIRQEVFFNAAASTPRDGTYTWNFGDGTPVGSGVTTTHQYLLAGTFSVTLTVTNSVGQSATTTRTVTVSTTSPGVTASFTFSPTTPGVRQEVFFNASASTPRDGTFTWNFGDGTPAGSGVTPTHQYSLAGTFTVTLTVTNSVGQSATTTRAVTVSATSPGVTASFTFSPTTPGINQNVFFNATASTPATAVFTWSFGDGSGGTGVTPTHQYGRAGTYTVTLIVTISDGQSATTSKTITVSAPAALVADFTAEPNCRTLVSTGASASGGPLTRPRPEGQPRIFAIVRGPSRTDSRGDGRNALQP